MTRNVIAAALVGSPDLLDDAARAAIVRRASVPTADIELPDAAPARSTDSAGRRFVTVMQLLLSQSATGREPLVAEALTLLAAAGKTLPTRLLVPLLDVSRSSQAITDALPAVLGERGRWLASLRPDWLKGRALSEVRPEHWDEGTIAERVAWLRHVRANEPALGRDLVANLGKEKASDRAQLVAALAVGRSLDDEPLLEAALDDRSKEVARGAATLLASLAGSAYLARAEDLARGMFTRQRRLLRTWIEATAPPADSAARDRYGEILSVQAPEGPVARVLRVVALVAPKRWPELCGVTADDLAGGVWLDDESVSLLSALAAACRRFGDVETAQALLAHSFDPFVFGLLPDAQRLAAATTLIRTASGRDLFGICIALPGRLLPRESTAALLARLRPTSGANALAAHEASPLFELIGERADPRHARDWRSALELMLAAPEVSDERRDDIQSAMRRLSLRESIYEAIYDKENQ